MQLKLKPGLLRFLITKLCILLSLVSNLTSATENGVLTVTPEQCVSLTQGQKCYVDATLNWSLPNKGNYCLFSSQQIAPLFCWKQKQQGQFVKEFATDKNIIFTLKAESNLEVKAIQKLKVTWVHQKRGQPRLWWRIF